MKLPAHRTLPDVESKRAEKTKCFLSFLSAKVIVRVTRNNCRNEIFRGKCDLAEFQIPFAGFFLTLDWNLCLWPVAPEGLVGFPRREQPQNTGSACHPSSSLAAACATATTPHATADSKQPQRAGIRSVFAFLPAKQSTCNCRIFGGRAEMKVRTPQPTPAAATPTSRPYWLYVM